MTQPSPTDEPIILQNLRKYPQIQARLTWIPRQLKRVEPSHPLLSILLRHDPWQQKYLASIDSDFKILDATPNLNQLVKRMENGRQFFDELSAVRLASSLTRKGFWVEFISEGAEKRPDILAKKDRESPTSCVFEVKHLSGGQTIGVIFEDIRKIPSPYTVEATAKEFQLESQVRHLTATIASEMCRLEDESAKPTKTDPFVLTKGDAHVSIYIDPGKKNKTETWVRVSWSFTEEFVDTIDRLSNVLTRACHQLQSYLPEAVNIIVLDVEKAALHGDEIEDTLRWKPRLFSLDEYRIIAGVEFISNVIPLQDVLFANSNNQHVKSGLVQALGLSENVKTIAYPSVPIASLPISEERRGKVIAEFLGEFSSWAIARRILNVVPWKANSRAESNGFRKIGFNDIVDKIWYVDNPPDVDGYLSVQGIGSDYGRAVAQAETKAVVDRLIEASPRLPSMSYKEMFSPETLEAGVKILGDNGFHADVVLSNIHDFGNLWQFGGFVRGIVPNTSLKTSSGGEVAIHDAVEVPDGIILLLDRGAAGSIVLKEDATLVISEISEEEKPAILKVFRDITAEQLKQKVKLHVEEVFRVDIDEPKAILTLKKQGNNLHPT